MSSNEKSSQPSILNIKSIPTSSAMKIESDILEPLLFSQSECVFEFAPKGFLHAGSCISIGFKDNANLNTAFPYANIGIHSLVRRAVLRTTAGRVICDTEDWNYLQGCKSMFMTNGMNKEREQYLSGRQVNFELIYDDSSSEKASGYGLGNNKEYDQLGGTYNLQGLSGEEHLKMSSKSEFQIKLHELFPYMKAGNTLPLFLLPNERVQVQLFWTDLTDRVALPHAAAAHVAEQLEIDQARTKLISDHIFYDGDTMAKFEASNKSGLTFEYIDYRLSKQSLVSRSASGVDWDAQYDTKNNVRNIGGNGMIVEKVFFAYEEPNRNCTRLLGKFGAAGMHITGAGAASTSAVLKSNIFFNNEYLYPQEISNPARQFHNLKETGNMIPFITREAYSGEGGGGLSTTAEGAYEGLTIQHELASNFFWNGFNLKGQNKRVDNRGLELHTNATEMADLKALAIGSYTQRVWLEIKRYVIIKDGHLECYFA
tara:strand:- start:367 stop:1818 length:1452 start_codon:yes stop_codon:yes gene_type:complete